MTRSKHPSNVPRPELARKSRPSTKSTASHQAERAEVERAPIQALPAWHWRTFPVFFALALGLFVGVFLGVPSGAAAESTGNQWPTIILFMAAAIFMGAAFSRFTTRWMLARKWTRRKK